MQFVQFIHPPDKKKFGDYEDFIKNPINLSKIEEKINANSYTSTEAFISDIKWILHNCNIYFSSKFRLSTLFLMIIKYFDYLYFDKF